MERYKGFSYKELNNKFEYDHEQGRFYSKKSGRLLDSTKGGKMYLGVRVGDEVIALQPARVAYILHKNYFLKDDEVIKFEDGDHLNFEFSNLLVVKKAEKALSARHVVKPKSVETDVEGVARIMPMGYYVARRGPTQAVYRTNSYEEAVEVRREWEKDKSIHRWDTTMPLHFRG